MLLDETTYKIAVCFVILLLGFTLSKITENLVTRILRKKYRPGIEKVSIAYVSGMAINILALVAALSFLNISLTENTLLEIYSYAPFALSIILLGILVVLLVKIVFYVLDKFFSKSGIREMVREYGQEQALTNLLFVLKCILYILFGLVALNSLGVNVDSTILLFESVLYPLLILGLVLLFVGLKPYVENYFSGQFLKRMNFLRVGEQIKTGKEEYTIDALNSQGIVLKGKSSFNTFIPFKTLYTEKLHYREIMYDLTTLEKIKNNFLAQHSSYCGPASASMILKIFGYDINQEKIGQAAKTVVPTKRNPIPGGTRPKDLMAAVEKLTENKVNGVWISIEKITDLKQELKTWLDNKALVIIDYKKSFLFPEAQKAHYSVCLSVRGDEMLIMDPSSKKGGVYFADIKKAYLGMNTYSELLKEKRGYIVLAPKGTTAYHRIEKGLIFSDPNLYNDLNNNLTKELDSLMRKAGKLENILPKSIKNIIDEYKRKEKITRVWSPRHN